MDTMAISKKQYTKPKGKIQHVTFADLHGALRDADEFKGKTSVEVQKMIPELWSKKYRKSRL